MLGALVTIRQSTVLERDGLKRPLRPAAGLRGAPPSAGGRRCPDCRPCPSRAASGVLAGWPSRTYPRCHAQPGFVSSGLAAEFPPSACIKCSRRPLILSLVREPRRPGRAVARPPPASMAPQNVKVSAPFEHIEAAAAPSFGSFGNTFHNPFTGASRVRTRTHIRA